MRIAVTGTHGSGKTTLIDDFVDARRDYEREEEPYWALAQNGVPFADGASIPDLEQQLAASAELILARAGDAKLIFDRCPVDFIAYLDVVGTQEDLDWTPSGRLLKRIERALATLEMLVFLPLQNPDDIAGTIEFPKLRASVDRRLKSILRDDMLGLFVGRAPKIVELRGSRGERLKALCKLVSE